MMYSFLTARAIAIGMFLAVAINLYMLYIDYFLKNTLLIFNHLPTVGTAVLLLLAGLGALMRKTGRGKPFSQGEMLLIWIMIGVAGGIGSTGWGRAVIGFAASPAYMTTASNDYVTYLLANIPDWMVVSKDPDSNAVRWYFEGLPRDKAIPWGEWLVPMAAWSFLGICLFALMFAFTSMFYRQWAYRERLTFPIIYLPLALTQEPGKGKLINDFLRNPLVWIGAAIPMVIFGINGIRNFFPGIPEITNSWATWGFFPDRPWDQFHMSYASIYFSIIGLTFLLTTEVSLSIWFFFFLYRLSFVYVAWRGAAGGGFLGNWAVNLQVFEAAGATFTMAFFLFWTARHWLRDWLKRAMAGKDDREADLLPARLTLVLLLAGLGGSFGWVMFAGAAWWEALLGMGLFICVILVLTRLVVEAGLLLIGTEAIAYEFVTGLVPPSWVSGGAIGAFVELRGALMSDLREILMPYLMNGVRACANFMSQSRKMLGILALTALVALGSAIYGRITTGYKYGATHGDYWYNGGWQRSLYPHAVSYQKSPPTYQMIRAGEAPLFPVPVAHTLIGAGLTGLMLFMRSRFFWWPLNPLGFIVCGSWAVEVIWFSVFLGWIAKSAVMKFGGATAYRRLPPFFLGLVLGEALIASFWTIISLFTGLPGIPGMLPH